MTNRSPIGGEQAQRDPELRLRRRATEQEQERVAQPDLRQHMLEGEVGISLLLLLLAQLLSRSPEVLAATPPSA
jgi:hypothetical protein